MTIIVCKSMKQQPPGGDKISKQKRKVTFCRVIFSHPAETGQTHTGMPNNPDIIKVDIKFSKNNI